MSNSSQWFLAQLKPNGLERATENLSRQGIESFMPVRLVNVRHGRRSIMTKKPLFGGYLFLSVDPANPCWRAINSTYGISRLVSFGNNEPSPLPAVFIAGLRARCSDDGTLMAHDDLKVGEKVRAVSGPFADYIATIEAIPSQTRLAILFDFMGQKTRANISVDQVEKVRLPSD